MDDLIIYTLIGTLIALALGLILLFKNKNRKEDVPDGTETGTRARRIPPVVNDGAAAARVGPNRAAANRNARGRMRAAQNRRDQEDEEETELEKLGEEIQLPDGKIGKKKMLKLAAKAEKRSNREAEEREREERKDRNEKVMEQRKKDDDKLAEIEAQQDEEEKKEREEREKDELEEYQHMKLQFAVEEEGFEQGLDADQEQNLFKDFVEHIKNEKVVLLEDLAAKFKLKTPAVIDRINDMQADGTLTGVIDDRGKFIYISMTELEGFAKFIKQRGRISLSDLAESSHTLINLTPETKVAG